jgi:catechol 2,3-dioxygenase-like lactoylglutathione lyase family enzyme
MLDHVSVGVRDIAAARRFYDATLGALGYTALYAGADSLGYGKEAPKFWVSAAAHPVAADPQSGLHVCFAAPSRAAVDAFHAAALGNGGGDNGAPGLRPDYDANYYAAFVTDPDGYRLEAYCGTPA